MWKEVIFWPWHLHGISYDKAKLIIQQGFDDRLTNRKLYGHGVYFTTDFCKTADMREIKEESSFQLREAHNHHDYPGAVADYTEAL